jgi:ubiquinol-cytochrome c reductase iron-sulfur subunit
VSAERPDRPRQPSAATAETIAATCFLVAAAAAIGLGVVYWRGGQTQLEGLLLAVATGGIGVGIVVWAKRFMPDEEVTEDRKPLVSSEEDIAAFRADFEHGEHSIRGRRRLIRSLGVAIAALGAALLFPIRSLGPRPGRGLKVTGYGRARPGRPVRLVRRDDEDPRNPGVPVRPDELAVDGILTVWPEGDLNAADSPTLLIRTRREQRFELPPERMGWIVEGDIVAYSKICTHVGCPISLYEKKTHHLLCPCHQSTFDLADAAKVVFGPAARALPQLPLSVDEEGYLVAQSDFKEPVGPSYWERDSQQSTSE